MNSISTLKANIMYTCVCNVRIGSLDVERSKEARNI